MTRRPPPQRRVWPPETYEQITLQRVGDKVLVLTAPLLALISLELLTHADLSQMELHRDMIRIAQVVEYQVIGWDRDARALIVRRVADRRGGQSPEPDELRQPEGIPLKGDTPS